MGDRVRWDHVTPDPYVSWAKVGCQKIHRPQFPFCSLSISKGETHEDSIRTDMDWRTQGEMTFIVGSAMDSSQGRPPG